MSLAITDLPVETSLDRRTLSGLRGGMAPLVNVDIGITQNFNQLQDIDIAVLNNSVIGRGFGPFSLDVVAPQIGANSAPL